MPDLGKYAPEVLGSYGLAIVLLCGVILLTWWRGRAVRRALRAVEAQQRRHDG